MEAGLQADINATIRKLYRIEPHVRKYIKQDLGEASSILVSAIKGRTPVGTKAHKNRRPGNLRRSIVRLPLRRAKSAVLVGPKTGRGNIDGFYAKFLEFGTKYIRPRKFIEQAEAVAGPIAQRFALKLLERRLESYKKANSV